MWWTPRHPSRHPALEMASSVLTSLLPTKVARAVQPARHVTTVRLYPLGLPLQGANKRGKGCRKSQRP